MSKYPDRPWQVSLYTSACERVYILEGISDESAKENTLIQNVASAICADVNSRLTPGEQSFQFAKRALQYVQSRGYVPDPAGEEWFQRPDYTAMHGGDCEDLAGLFVAICRAAGVMARLVWIDQVGAELNHVTAQVYVGKTIAKKFDSDDGWIWAEGSIDGADLGENPYHAAKRFNRHDILGVSRAA